MVCDTKYETVLGMAVLIVTLEVETPVTASAYHFKLVPIAFNMSEPVCAQRIVSRTVGADGIAFISTFSSDRGLSHAFIV